MGLEAATYISQLVVTNPVGAIDPKSQGDDHLRLIKSVLQASFPNIGGAVTATHTQLNNAALSGLTGFAAASNTVKPSGAAAGSATTALRSDVQLVLDLAQTYAWTATHTWSTGSAGNVHHLDSSAGFGPYVSYARNGTIFGDVGNARQLGSSFTLDALGMSARSGYALELGANGSGPHLRIQTNGRSLFLTDIVTVNDGTGYVQLNTSGDNNPGFISFHTNEGTRRGYIGYNASSRLQIVGENSYAWQVDDLLASSKINTSGRGQLQDGSLAVIDVPRNDSALARGQTFLTSSNVTINTSHLVAGYTYAIHNDSSSPISIVQGSGVTLRLAGTTATGTRTLAPFGIATIWVINTTDAVVGGNVS